MSVRRNIAASMAVLVMILILFAPVSDADIVERTDCNGVNVVVFNNTVEIDMDSSESVVFHITNTNSNVATVRISMNGNGNVTSSPNPITVPVKANQTVDQTIDLITSRHSAEGQYVLSFDISVTANGTDASNVLNLNCHISSSFSSYTTFNKFFGIIDNNLPSPLNEPAFTAIVTLIGWVFLSIAVSKVGVYLLRTIFLSIGRRIGTCDENVKQFGIESYASIGTGTFLFGIINSMHVLGLSESIIADVSLVFNFIYIFVAAFLAWGIYKAIVYYGLHAMDDHDDSVDGFDVTLIPLFNLLGKVIIGAIATGVALTTLGLNIAAIITGAGIAGIGISLGVKPAFNELFAGISVLINRPFKVGDTVIVGSEDAREVTGVGVLKTTFCTNYTNETIMVPNSVIASSKIVNLTCNTKKYRTLIYVDVDRTTNIAFAKKLLKEVAYEHPHVVKDASVAKPEVIVDEYRDDGRIKLRLAVYVDCYDDKGSIGGQLREAIVKKFRANNVNITFIQKDIFVYDETEESK